MIGAAYALATEPHAEEFSLPKKKFRNGRREKAVKDRSKVKAARKQRRKQKR